jgi:hypothetical protein
VGWSCKLFQILGNGVAPIENFAIITFGIDVGRIIDSCHCFVPPCGRHFSRAIAATVSEGIRFTACSTGNERMVSYMPRSAGGSGVAHRLVHLSNLLGRDIG